MTPTQLKKAGLLVAVLLAACNTYPPYRPQQRPAEGAPGAQAPAATDHARSAAQYETQAAA